MLEKNFSAISIFAVQKLQSLANSHNNNTHKKLLVAFLLTLLQITVPKLI